MSHAVIALGSNLGERVDFLDAAVAALDDIDGIRVDAVSPWYESIAHTLLGLDTEGPRYLNGVALIETSHSPARTLQVMLELETLLGRPAEHAPWSDRTLDLDLIDFDSVVLAGPRLTLPHPRAHERVFVLQPWHDLEPDAILIGHGPIGALLLACPAQERAALKRIGARR